MSKTNTVTDTSPARRMVSLQAHNSFGCPCVAEHFFDLSGEDAHVSDQALQWLNEHPDALILGAGSNIVLATPQIDAVLKVGLRGISVAPAGSPSEVLVCASAGENWHEFVQWTLAHDYYGLENLALIPGTVGAAPVQNIGAYGVELGDSLESVDAIDRHNGQTQRLSRLECRLGYRDSVFKQEPGRWLITSVCLRLSRLHQPRLGYGHLREALAADGINNPGARQIANKVCQIRQSKLPDPATLGNAGSFFKNPVINKARADELKAQWPDMPVYPGPSASPTANGAAAQVKLAAGWLIEQCGLKGLREGDAGVHVAHALVLVNYGQATGAGILALADKIIARVNDKFGVTLEPEPLLIRPAGTPSGHQ